MCLLLADLSNGIPALPREKKNNTAIARLSTARMHTAFSFCILYVMQEGQPQKEAL